MSRVLTDLRVMHRVARFVAFVVLFVSAALVSVEAVAFAQADIRLIAMEHAYEAEHRSWLSHPSMMQDGVVRLSLDGTAT